MKNTKVILDTNFLLIPEQFHVDVFGEVERLLGSGFEFFIIDQTMNELEKIRLNAKSGKDKLAAKVGIALVENNKIQSIQTEPKQGKIVDDYIVELTDSSTVVATTDVALKRRLMEKGIGVIELVQKKYLRFINF